MESCAHRCLNRFSKRGPIHCKADECAPHDILFTAPQYVDICSCHNFPNFATRYSILLGGTVLTYSFRCVLTKKIQRLVSSTDLHAQSTLSEYDAFSHCQTYSRVLCVPRAENTPSASEEAHLSTATVELF